jgi:hypothetical protein
MELAALASFAALFLAWLVAPDRPRTAPPADFVPQEVEPLTA